MLEENSTVLTYEFPAPRMTHPGSKMGYISLSVRIARIIVPLGSNPGGGRTATVPCISSDVLTSAKSTATALLL
jgi:hypothetical protein